MPLLILHLSDIHITEDISSLMERIPFMSDALKEYIGTDVTNCFIITSGDIAFAGTENQYNLALNFFENITKSIKTNFPSLQIEILVVPGNHDCDFTHDTQTRKILLETLTSKDRELDDGIFEQCTSIQDNYFFFAALITNIDFSNGYSRIFNRAQYDVSGSLIAFNCYNTAWLSQKNEDQGHLKYPTEYLQNITSFDTKYDCVISVFHHSYNWLESNNARDFRNHIERTSDIILTGHEHVPDQIIQENISGNVNEYIAGGVLASKLSTESSFNVILLDIPNRQQKILQFHWDKSLYTIVQKRDWFPFARALSRERNEFQNNNIFRNHLLDPGAHYTHPRKGALKLEDFFVYPALREIDLLKMQLGKKEQTIASNNTFDYLYEKSRVIIIGNGTSGKTALAKILYVRIQHLGKIPILLDGKDVTNSSEGKIDKLLHEMFNAQYSQELFAKYKQLESDKKVLIIDDFHKSPLNIKQKNIVLGYLGAQYSKIIIFSNELLQIEEISSPESQNLFQYVHCEIKEWSFVLKEKLIQRWISLGRERQIEDDERAHLVRDAENRVNTLLGKNLLPSYPWVVLAILQSLDAGVELNTVMGTYGYFYQMLITKALSEAVKKRETVDLKFTYLSEIAYFLHRNKLSEITEDNILEINKYYFDKYKINIPDDIFFELVQARIIQKTAGYYRFNYSYIYYFFVARHMANHLFEDEIKRQIETLCAEVYKEDNANIIIFLSYHSKDPFIIKTIITNAESIFKNFTPCDLDQDIRFLDELCHVTPKLLLPSGNADEHKEQYLQEKDELEETMAREEKSSEQEQVSRELLEFNMAFKSLQIMGQTLRNFAASLHGDVKIELTKSCYYLGLKFIKAAFAILEANWKQIEENIKEYLITECNQKNDERTERKAKEFLYIVAQAIAFSTIKKISFAVGSEQLKEIYKIILDEATTTAHAIIDVSIKLDHFSEVPEKQIYELNVGFKSNPFSQNLLHLLVGQYLYLFPCKREIRQRLCSKLGFKQESPMMLKSSTKKLKS